MLRSLLPLSMAFPALLTSAALSADVNTVELDNDFGYSAWVSPGPSGVFYDASGARWDFRNSDAASPTESTQGCTGSQINKYPVQLKNYDDLTLYQPLIEGHVSLTAVWGYVYGPGGACNAAALRMESGHNQIIDGARITRTWDAIRTAYWDSGDGDFRIRNTWVSDARDDCVENDSDASGVIQDSLFDGCFQGISMRSGASKDNSANTLVIDGVLMKMQAHNHSEQNGSRQRYASGQAFKVDGTSARVVITDSVFAFDTPLMEGHASNTYRMIGDSRFGSSYGEKLKSCSNNKVLWMHDDDPPAVLEQLDSCFTLITGAEARAEWEAARCAWINSHPPGVTRRSPSDDVASCAVADSGSVAPEPPVVYAP